MRTLLSILILLSFAVAQTTEASEPIKLGRRGLLLGAVGGVVVVAAKPLLELSEHKPPVFAPAPLRNLNPAFDDWFLLPEHHLLESEQIFLQRLQAAQGLVEIQTNVATERLPKLVDRSPAPPDFSAHYDEWFSSPANQLMQRAQLPRINPVEKAVIKGLVRRPFFADLRLNLTPNLTRVVFGSAQGTWAEGFARFVSRKAFQAEVSHLLDSAPSNCSELIERDTNTPVLLIEKDDE